MNHGLHDCTKRGRLRPTNHQRLYRPSSQQPRASSKMETTIAADLHFILINVCKGPATTCRQNAINSNGLETWRQLRFRFSIPTGTRSVGYGYLTKLIKPRLDETKFEESFAQWEQDVQRYEQHNGTPLPLQQHLQLNASQATTTNSEQSS